MMVVIHADRTRQLHEKDMERCMSLYDMIMYDIIVYDISSNMYQQVKNKMWSAKLTDMSVTVIVVAVTFSDTSESVLTPLFVTIKPLSLSFLPLLSGQYTCSS